MAVQVVYRHTSRRDVEDALYVMLRMMHVRGWRRLVAGVERGAHIWLAVELAPDCREDDARDWSYLFDRRYRVDVGIDELLADPWRFNELYLDGGVGVLLDQVERRQLDRERLKRAAKR